MSYRPRKRIHTTRLTLTAKRRRIAVPVVGGITCSKMIAMCASPPVDHRGQATDSSSILPSTMSGVQQRQQQRQQQQQHNPQQQQAQCTRGVLRETWRRRRAERLIQMSGLGPVRHDSQSLSHNANTSDRGERGLKNMDRGMLAPEVMASSQLAAYARIVAYRNGGGTLTGPSRSLPSCAGKRGNASSSADPIIESLSPEKHLLALLKRRGWNTEIISFAEAGYDAPPTARQVKDYESKPFMSDLVRRGDMEGLRDALEAGRSMDASNKFGESVVHVACRRGNMDVLRFLLAHGGSLTCCDDLGRFPLHEVCWAVEPRFDIIRLFLEREQEACKAQGRTAGCGRNPPSLKPAPNIFLVADKRGCTPLRYVKKHSWPQWRAFLDEIADVYWPSVVSGDDGNSRDAAVGVGQEDMVTSGTTSTTSVNIDGEPVRQAVKAKYGG